MKGLHNHPSADMILFSWWDLLLVTSALMVTYLIVMMGTEAVERVRPGRLIQMVWLAMWLGIITMGFLGPVS